MTNQKLLIQLAAQKRALEMILKREPLHDILEHLARVVEELAEGRTIASILLLDSAGALRNGASPNLPRDYVTAIDGIIAAPNVGTCGVAASTGDVVVTPDFKVDPNWAKLRHLPLALGFAGAWSLPIKASDGKVLGTFGTYFRECRGPTQEEVEAVEILASTAALAIETAAAEAKRAASEAALRESDRRKDEFLAVLAHELRNPLAPVHNSLRILRQAKGDSNLVAQSLDIMERQVGQITALVDDLTDVSMIARGKVNLVRERIDISVVCQSAIESARPAIEQRQHEFEYVRAKSPVWVVGDQVRLTQVFANLLNNAARYTPPGGRVSLTTENGDTHVTISVADTGIGIEPAALPSVFELFFQAARPAGVAGGLGIGLTVARDLIALHGGTISVHSPGLNRGAVFTVMLPLAAAENREDMEQPPGSAGPVVVA